MTAPVGLPADDAPAIAVRDLFCLYGLPSGGSVAALRGLSLTVAAGERLVVHGPNGSGKTTLLRVLLGELEPSAGAVQLAGLDLTGADPAARRRLRLSRVGMVDQHSLRTLRPELDVLDNIGLQLRLAGVRHGAARARAAELLEQLGLRSLADQPVTTLSGGEAQRVAVCAALAHRPPVLLADEPTGELDAAAAGEVYDLLADGAAEIGASLVVVTHDQRAARIADRVVRIRDGRLSEQWSPATPEDESLVVDDRGWLRLPERLRHRISAPGTVGSVRASAAHDSILLHHAPAPVPVAPTVGTGVPIGTVTPDGPVVARLDAVRVAYAGRTVLDGIELTVCGGRLSVLRGRSGSGKSSLLRVLLGLADPDGGTAWLGGQDLAGLGRTPRAELRARVVAVSGQGGSLAESLDVVENLAVARAARRLPADPALLRDLVERLGLGAVAGRPVRVLSGGERQRTAIARCLVVQRDLVVLDEPTSQQDEAHAALVGAVLHSAVAGGTAVLCATHDPVLVARADLLLALD